ncbi:hypothetical protein CEN47_18865 [Fischerella thermalis CCMEE 5319]|jgi:hypothetical protein|nr:hypothetical protein CEN47_18865 [Fischerella thermalis CCMEE 5319]
MITLPYLSISQVINPAISPDLMISTGAGTYTNVKNTGIYMAKCPACPMKIVIAMCWDGDNPGISTYVPTTPTTGVLEVLPLPAGSNDPDIVIGRSGEKGMVVFENGPGVYYMGFDNIIGGGNLHWSGLSGVLTSDGNHPNIDKPYDCEESFPEEIAVVYKDNSSGHDLYYRLGTLSTNFGQANPVTLTAGSRHYVADRIHPDINYIKNIWTGKEELNIVAIGEESSTGDFNIDVFIHPLISPTPPNTSNSFAWPFPVNPPFTNIRPRIDGLGLGADLNYFVASAINTGVIHGYESSWGTISGGLTGDNEMPAIATTGDYHDVIWSTTHISGNFDVIGRGVFYAPPTFDTYFKEVNDGVSMGWPDKLYPSVSGNCGFDWDYAICWWGTDDNIHFKIANAQANPQYIVQNPTGLPETISKQSAEIVIAKDEVLIQKNDYVVYNTLGQRIGTYEALNIKQGLLLLKPGMYVVSAKNKETQKTNTQKIVVY